MKYIDAEKLIAEIERRIEETKSMRPAFDQFFAGGDCIRAMLYTKRYSSPQG